MSEVTDTYEYWERYFFDLSFFGIISIILLNLIFGIIIDAFSDIRDKLKTVEIDVKERCFICGLSRIEFETKNKSWVDHVQKEHNVFAYLYFILYIQKKPTSECNAVEKFVKERVLENDSTFFPTGMCFAITHTNEGDI